MSSDIMNLCLSMSTLKLINFKNKKYIKFQTQSKFNPKNIECQLEKDLYTNLQHIYLADRLI